VNRGGCWYGAAAIAHLSFPDANDPTDRGSNLGFRLAKEGT
jgi:formylglycine-generating enzyme required for sulfatase activity